MGVKDTDIPQKQKNAKYFAPPQILILLTVFNKPKYKIIDGTITMFYKFKIAV